MMSANQRTKNMDQDDYYSEEAADIAASEARRNKKRIVVFDFESEAIEPMPKYPPRPVGLAIMVDDKPLAVGQGYYNAWGHPDENNCYESSIREIVAGLIKQEDTLWIAHNLAFDAAIIEVKWGLTFPWDRCADTMLMAFMDDPYGQLSLKPLAEKHLGVPPTERDAVRDWLVANGICRAGDKNWGAHISKAPGKLVGAYAHGDITRTRDLYNFYLNKKGQ
jgi:hypothetical protein